MTQKVSRKRQTLHRVHLITPLLSVLLFGYLFYNPTDSNTSQAHHHGDEIHVSLAVRNLLRLHKIPINGNPSTAKKFVLYRALGNSLPPRHDANQTYNNLLFTLLHEPEFRDVEKRWYVNRLVRESEELRIVELLIEYKQTFVVDSIDWTYYRTLHDRVDVYDQDSLYKIRYNWKFARRVARIRDSLLHDKILYVMNNNGARNAMLELGFSAGADYVMPFDGNVYICPTAWRSIVSGIESRKDDDYFAVPMARVQHNDHACAVKQATEEPQVIFRRGSTERFNETLRYGRRPKLELLWRLGVPGAWTNASLLPGEERVGPFAEASSIGWCTRLADGVFVFMKGNAKLREELRSIAVERTLSWCDWHAHREMEHDDGLLLTNRQLRQLHQDYGDGVVNTCVAQVLRKHEATPHKCSVAGIRQLCEQAIARSLAGYITDDLRLTRSGHADIQAFISMTETCDMSFLLQADQALPLMTFLEAVHVLRLHGAIRVAEVRELKDWFGEFAERVHGEGDWYDLLMAGVGAFVGDFRFVVRASRFGRDRGLAGGDAEVLEMLAVVARRIGVPWGPVVGGAGEGNKVPFSWLFRGSCV